MIDERQSRKVIADFNIEFPPNMKPEHIALIIKDYIHLMRFTVGLAEVSVYPINTKIVQHPLSLESKLPDQKH